MSQEEEIVFAGRAFRVRYMEFNSLGYRWQIQSRKLRLPGWWTETSHRTEAEARMRLAELYDQAEE